MIIFLVSMAGGRYEGLNRSVTINRRMTKNYLLFD